MKPEIIILIAGMFGTFLINMLMLIIALYSISAKIRQGISDRFKQLFEKIDGLKDEMSNVRVDYAKKTELTEHRNTCPAYQHYTKTIGE